jgi:uncharacterized membrane protein YfcA
LNAVARALAFDFETAKNASLWTVAGAVVLALLAVWVVKEALKKVLTVVLLLAIALLAWSQRTELTACADNVQETIAAGLVPDTTCSFFGQDVTVPGSATLLGPDGTAPTSSTTTSTP